MEFEEPSQAQKRIPQKQQDLELLSEQQSKNHIQKPQEGGQRQLKTLEWAKCPQEQAITEKQSADDGKVHKQPYCMVGDLTKTTKGEKMY